MDVETVSIGLGLMVTALFTELFGLAAGGMVVPGYLALSLDKPLDIVATLAAAIITYGIATQCAKSVIIYGRRKIVLMIVTGFVVGWLLRTALAAGFAAPQETAEVGGIAVIGFIIPGLIALWFERQGIIETVSVLAASSSVVRLVLILFHLQVAI